MDPRTDDPEHDPPRPPEGGSAADPAPRSGIAAQPPGDARAPDGDDPGGPFVPVELDGRTAALADAVSGAASRRAAELLAGREFATYRCGTLVPAALARARRGLVAAFREAVRARMSAALEVLRPGARLELLRPDVVVEAAPDAGGATLIVAPVYVAGRYRKLSRDMSQTVFHCRVCRGRGGRRARGCVPCGSTGRVVRECVEDFVAPPILRAAAGAASAFHGSGREDVDVRMLGGGRPFVVSVESPMRRTPDLASVPAEVAAASGGRVEVADLRFVTRDDMGRITSDHAAKAYRAVIAATTAEPFPDDAAERLARLAGAELDQRTPRRVDRRRADLVRRRCVLTLDVEETGARRIVVRLRTDPGTYVKEFVSGDEGRTSPSAAAALGVPCVCAELDVLETGEGGAVTSGTS